MIFLRDVRRKTRDVIFTVTTFLILNDSHNHVSRLTSHVPRHLRAVKGFTLVEIVTVLVIIGIGMTLFYSVFFLNWFAVNSYIARADLWQEMDAAIDQISLDARLANDIVLTQSGTQKNVNFLETDPVTRSSKNLSEYLLDSSGKLQVRRGTATLPSLISDHVNFAKSSFTLPSFRDLKVDLTLNDDVLGKTIEINSSTEIYRRN